MASQATRDAIDEYKFLCWLGEKVPSARVIRDLLREGRVKEGEGSEKR